MIVVRMIDQVERKTIAEVNVDRNEIESYLETLHEEHSNRNIEVSKSIKYYDVYIK